MRDIETRVRQAMLAEAERARPEELRPIVVNSPQRQTPRRRWLAPAAAALVVATTIAGVAVAVHASGLFAGRSRPMSSTFAKPPWPVRDNRMPAFYVTIYYGKAVNRTTITMTAAVYSSATGALLGTVALPNLNGPSGSAPVITAAGDDRHFVIALPTAPSGVTRFYLLTLGVNGRTASLATLPIRPIPAKSAVSGIALTPDGTRLAITIAFPYYRPQYYHEGKPTSEIKVLDLVTGSVRTWTTSEHIPLGSGGASEPSWGDGGRLLGFLWNEHDGVPDRGLYIMNTATPGSNLMAARRLFRGIGGGLNAYLTNSGQTVIADMDASDHRPGAPMDDGYPSVVEYSARTGQVIRALCGPPRKATPAGCGLVAIDPSGKYLLVTNRHFGRLVDGTFTRLALKPGTVPIVAW